MDDVTAAGFAIAYGTAHGALRWRAGLHAGETLLVHGAGGGVGLTAVECGKAIGAMVIATARGEEKLAVAREHGADHVVDSEDPDLKGRLRELTDGRGADVVYDPVGGAVFDASLRAIAWEGRIVIVGFASGQVPQIPANLLLVKNAAVLGFYWGSYRKHDPERLRDGFSELFDWHREGRIRPHVSQTLPLAQTADAIRLLAERRSHRQGRGDHALDRTVHAAVCRLAPSRRAAAYPRRMNGLKLVIGSTNASSWSLRPWLLLKQLGLPFEEIVIPLRQPDTAAAHPTLLAIGQGAGAARGRACGSGTRWRSPNIWRSEHPDLVAGRPGGAGAGACGQLRDAQRLRRPAHLPAHGLHRPLRARRASCWRRSRATSTGSSRIWAECRRARPRPGRSCSASSPSPTPCSRRSARASPPMRCR